MAQVVIGYGERIVLTPNLWLALLIVHVWLRPVFYRTLVGSARNTCQDKEHAYDDEAKTCSWLDPSS